MRRYPAGEAGELLELFDSTVRPILGDPDVWAEEAARRDAPPIPWPMQRRGKGYQQLLRIFFMEAVDHILGAIEEADGRHVPPADAANEDFQLILRVAARAICAADIKLKERFGGTGRMSLKRELMKWGSENDAERAIRSGKPRNEAFQAAGLSRAGAYRALKRR